MPRPGAEGDLAISKTQVFDFFCQFKNGREIISKEKGHFLHQTLCTPKNIKAVKDAIEAERRASIADIMFETGLSYWVAQTILTADLKLSKKAAR